MKKILISLFAGVIMFTLAISLTSIAKATPPHNQVRLCHHTEGGHYNDITVDDDAVFQQGHDQHQGGQDIIPPFSYQTWEVTGTQLVCPNGYPNSSTLHPGYCYKNGSNIHWPEDYRAKVSEDVYGLVTHNYAGKNWDTAGQEIWNNGCVIPSPSPSPSVSPTPTPTPTPAPTPTPTPTMAPTPTPTSTSTITPQVLGTATSTVQGTNGSNLPTTGATDNSLYYLLSAGSLGLSFYLKKSGWAKLS